MTKVIVTGCAGFIGSHLVDKLLQKKIKVTGIDNFNNYYNPKIKWKNINSALKNKYFHLYNDDILNYQKLAKIFIKEKPHIIIHLAAQAGVRPSIGNPILYQKVNVEGTINILKLAVDYNIEQFIFVSSSSVYGNSKQLPFSENDKCLNIISPYGSSKRSAEFWVESFYKSFGLKSIILRFFTVYGPRGRPDMAPALFTKAILNNQAINQFGDGSTGRDYTYIDDIIDGIIKSLDRDLGFEIINLGNNHPVTLIEFINILESILNARAKIRKFPIQIGDVEKTWANVVKAKELLGWTPKTNLKEGLKKYVEWLKTPN